jgi:DUF1680 family protein
VVYCLESIDLPDGVSLSEVFVPRDATWRPRYAPNILGGMTLLHGELRVVPQYDMDALYHDLESDIGEPVQVNLIPYFAWNNRGVTEMAVWLPVI